MAVLPSSEKMEYNVLEGVHVEGLLGAHNSPDVQHMSAYHLESRSVSNAPLITASSS